MTEQIKDGEEKGMGWVNGGCDCVFVSVREREKGDNRKVQENKTQNVHDREGRRGYCIGERGEGGSNGSQN